jgi:DNA-binding MarR family transcriptional regulator
MPVTEQLPPPQAGAQPDAQGVRALEQEWLVSNIGYLCTRVAAQVKRDFAAQTSSLEVTAVEFSLLTLLAKNEDVNQKQLCQALDLSPSRMAVILDRLEERGLVRRVRGTEDRRETYLHLAAPGRKLFERARAGAQAADAAAAEPLSVGERQMLLELLQKVARLRR